MIDRENWSQAQYSVLGSVLIDGSTVPKVVQQMRQTDFFAAGRTVFRAIVKLFQEGQPVDPVTVVHTLGPSYRELVKQLMEITPSAANLDTYMKLCREQAQLVTVRELAGKLMEVESNDAARKILEEATALMVDKTSVQVYSMEDCMKSFFERHTGEIKYLKWPLKVLNRVLYTEPGDFVIIGGKPSAGKSAFALQCAEFWSQDMKVGFFSLETGKDKLSDRMVSSKAAVNMDVLKQNRISTEQWDQITPVSLSLIKQNLWVIPCGTVSVADIRSTTIMHGFQLIIIDYVQLIAGSGGNRTEEVTGISMGLHRMAQDLGVTVVGLSQVRRSERGQGKKYLDSSDLRESGQLEQDADAILLLQLTREDDYGGSRDLVISKNKEGKCPRLLLDFDGDHQTFSSAKQTGSVISEMKAAANKAKRERAAQARTADESYTQEQFEMLPPGTPVPFED